MSFKVQDNSWSNRDNPRFYRPRVKGYFSISQSDEFSHDSSQLKYFNPPEERYVNMDLNEGYEQVPRRLKDQESMKLDYICRWVLLNSDRIKAHCDKKRWLEPEFIFPRQALTSLLHTPYEKRQGWIICAAKWKGTIYLCQFQIEEKKQWYMSDRHSRFSYWGRKFDQYIVSDTPDQLPDTSRPVNQLGKFCCVFQSVLGRHSLFYTAIMDGVCSKETFKDPIPLEKFEFIELKINRLIECPRQRYNFNTFKLRDWWCQSYPVGIQNILCGFRDEEGFLKELKTYMVSDLPRMSKGYWQPSECMQFCDAFLNHLKNVVVKDYDASVYKFEFTPSGDIEMEEMREPNEYSFLPQWYIDETRDLGNL